MSAQLTHLDLFSGIGGFALAAKWVGFETIGFCEIEQFPRKVLKKNFPGIPIHKDVRELDGKKYEGIGIITGGYPCQPFSMLGDRKGKNDPRHLWPEMLRVITQARPAWVVAENVAGHISMGLDSVLHDLEGAGYAARALVIPACAVGAPHQRDRVWVVAHSVSNGNQRTLGEHSRPNGKAKQYPKKKVRRFPDANSTSPASGWAKGWGTKPRIFRLADGIPNRLDRNKSHGNAIVPQVAYKIFSAIQKVEEKG